MICKHSTTQRQPHRPIIFYDFCITIYWLLFLRSIIIINLNVLFIEFRWASCHRYCPFPQSQCVLMGWNKRNWYGSEFCFIEVTMKDEYHGQKTSWVIWKAAGLLFLSREGKKHAVKKRMVEMWIVIFEIFFLFFTGVHLSQSISHLYSPQLEPGKASADMYLHISAYIFSF